MLNDRKATMADTTGTAKPKAKAAAKPPAMSDEALLAQQAQEERDAATAAADRVERERVDALPDEADGVHNGSLVDAVLEATRAANVQMLQRVWIARTPGAVVCPLDDDELLALEDELLAPAPTPAPAAVPEDLGVGEVPEWVSALLAGQAQQTNALIETLAEKLAGQTGQQINVGLSGDLETLVRQLEGTVSDGGDGDTPLAEPVTFMSKGKALKVIKKPRYRGVGHNGEQFFTTGIAADFAPTGTFTTRNPEMIEYLRERPGFNREYWELGKEPFSAPNPKIIMDKVLDATLTLDDQTLAGLEQEELAGHKRPFVLDAIRSARSRVQGFDRGGE